MRLADRAISAALLAVCLVATSTVCLPPVKEVQKLARDTAGRFLPSAKDPEKLPPYRAAEYYRRRRRLKVQHTQEAVHRELSEWGIKNPKRLAEWTQWRDKVLNSKQSEGVQGLLHAAYDHPHVKEVIAQHRRQSLLTPAGASTAGEKKDTYHAIPDFESIKLMEFGRAQFRVVLADKSHDLRRERDLKRKLAKVEAERQGPSSTRPSAQGPSIAEGERDAAPQPSI